MTLCVDRIQHQAQLTCHPALRVRAMTLYIDTRYTIARSLIFVQPEAQYLTCQNLNCSSEGWFCGSYVLCNSMDSLHLSNFYDECDETGAMYSTTRLRVIYVMFASEAISLCTCILAFSCIDTVLNLRTKPYLITGCWILLGGNWSYGMRIHCHRQCQASWGAPKNTESRLRHSFIYFIVPASLECSIKESICVKRPLGFRTQH